MNEFIQIMPSSNPPYLELFIGPMFSGKTSALCNIFKQYTISNKKPLVINHSIDTRYSDNPNEMFSHDNLKIPCTSVNKLSNVPSDSITNTNIILINEAQFFPDLKEFVQKMLKLNKSVYIAALDGDFKQQCFGDIPHLIPLCDKLTKLTALCSHCIKNGLVGVPAPFTYRVSDETEQTVVGTSNYIPVCRKCLNTLSKEK